jgi:hypothetical protein
VLFDPVALLPLEPIVLLINPIKALVSPGMTKLEVDRTKHIKSIMYRDDKTSLWSGQATNRFFGQ